MATITGTYVQTGLSSVDRVNSIVDRLLAPHLVEFRQIMIYHEPGTRVSSNTWRFTYQHWNPDFTPEVFLNQATTPVAAASVTVDENMGSVTLSGTYTTGDNVLATYCFDYFPIYVLEGFVYRSVDVINSAGAGVPTTFTLTEAPTNWDSIMADIVLSMCMEKLIIEYDLWKGRLIFAISPEELMSGGGNAMEALSLIKQNSEDRANRAMDNPKLKSGPYLSPPTQAYYDAITVGGAGSHHGGVQFSTRLRGWRANKYAGGTP
jgi:hypothetical protein